MILGTGILLGWIIFKRRRRLPEHIPTTARKNSRGSPPRAFHREPTYWFMEQYPKTYPDYIHEFSREPKTFDIDDAERLVKQYPTLNNDIEAAFSRDGIGAGAPPFKYTIWHDSEYRIIMSADCLKYVTFVIVK